MPYVIFRAPPVLRSRPLQWPAAVVGPIVTGLAFVPWTSRVPLIVMPAPLAMVTIAPAETVTVTPAGMVIAPLMSVGPDHVVLVAIVPERPVAVIVPPSTPPGGGFMPTSSPPPPVGAAPPTVQAAKGRQRAKAKTLFM